MCNNPEYGIHVHADELPSNYLNHAEGKVDGASGSVAVHADLPLGWTAQHPTVRPWNEVVDTYQEQ